MAKAELKTQKTDASVEDFLNSIADEARRQDCFTVLELMKKATKAEPKMWGSSIVGLGDFPYKYASGREGDWFQMGFSPRKDNLTLYFMPGLHEHTESLAQLGKYKTGKSCLYIKSLSDVDLKVLKTMMANAAKKQKAGK